MVNEKNFNFINEASFTLVTIVEFVYDLGTKKHSIIYKEHFYQIKK